MRTLLTAALAVTLTLPCLRAAVPDIVPRPVSVAEQAGAKPFTLAWGQTVGGDARFAGEMETLRQTLFPATGIWLKPAEANPTFAFVHDATLPKEGYALTVAEGKVEIRASEPAGAFYAIQTIRQLFPADIYRKAPVRGTWTMPAVTITDAPRYAWRGIMLDPCRNFFGVASLKRQLDAMAAHKLNVLHWHLTDDQGWRIEIKKYPRLTEIGAARPSTPRPFNRLKQDGEPVPPQFYTQEEIREVVAYAAKLHITIVPEIEMPGHAVAAIRAYPELACAANPDLTPNWGVLKEIFCAGNPKTYELLEGVLDEVVALFPGAYVHIGGDEAPKTRWNACPKCQAKMKALGCKNMHELQTKFAEHFAAYLAKKGRNCIGWDEILEGGLPKGAAIMSWRGTSAGVKAAKAGHKVVMTPKPVCYIDYNQLVPNDPYEYIPNNTPNPIWITYSIDPSEGLPPEAQPFVLGLQGNLWAEYIRADEDCDWKMWPRAAAIAEIGWTPQADRKWEDFHGRMSRAGMVRLQRLGLNAAPLTEPPKDK